MPQTRSFDYSRKTTDQWQGELRDHTISMMSASEPVIREIADAQTLEDALGHSRAVLLKHSTTCSISTVALDELMRFAGTHPDWEIYVLKVLEARDLSDTLSQRLGVRHESPQVFVVKDGCSVWHASHFDITARKLTEHVD